MTGDAARGRAARGEELAARALEAGGLEVLDRNWRSGRYEIDLVAREGDVIAFVEVKARGPGPQSPLEAIGPAQRKRIQRAAEAWIHAHPGVGAEFRFDAVSVRFDDEGAGPGSAARGPAGPVVRHVRDAWVGDR